MEDYLQKILRARVYDVAEETPLERAKNLSKKFENYIWLKREDLQPVFSFKLRGAFNRILENQGKDSLYGQTVQSGLWPALVKLWMHAGKGNQVKNLK